MGHLLQSIIDEASHHLLAGAKSPTKTKKGKKGGSNRKGQKSKDLEDEFEDLDVDGDVRSLIIEL